MKKLKNKTIVVTGGTGSLGKVLIKRILSIEDDGPSKVIVFSRDEAKQHQMRLEYLNNRRLTDEIIYHNFERALEFRIGDVRDYHLVCSVLKNADIVINAAALKQVPSCEYFPYEAVTTNITGAENIVRAINENNLNVDTVIGVSTDKACKPVNVMGMTKALQERVFISANILCPNTRFVCVRYGNVLASRGSVIPLFHEQINTTGIVTVTSEEMTRFLLPLEKAVDTIFAALEWGSPGEIVVPKVPGAKIIDVAKALIGDRKIKITYTGIRPGEKIHEIMVSDEEALRTYENSNYYAIRPMLPELQKSGPFKPSLKDEYCSRDSTFNTDQVREYLKQNQLLIEQIDTTEREFLR